jgi:SAM-dependent methyltransferase
MTDQDISSKPEHYLANTHAYDERIDAILPMSQTFFSSCISFIPQEAATLLELGSGTGFATSLIRAHRSQATITCIDRAPDMIQYARHKPDLQSVTIHEQDIRDPWPDVQYDVIMTTLCFHHIPSTDRNILLHRILQSLTPTGVFICGDIIRPGNDKAEEVYQERWVASMIASGIDEKAIAHILSSRRENYADMETIESFPKKLKDAGFSMVLMPYRHEISAVFVGYR